MRCYFSFITGVMVGLELEESEDCNYLIVELFIVQFIFEWEK
jgi:hypothetical protein